MWSYSSTEHSCPGSWEAKPSSTGPSHSKGRPTRAGPPKMRVRAPGKTWEFTTFNVMRPGALRAVATFAAAVIITSTFSTSTAETGTAPPTPDQARFAAAASVLIAAEPAAPVRHLLPDRADRAARATRTTTAAVTTAARSTSTSTTTKAKTKTKTVQQQTKPAQKAAVAQKPIKKIPAKPATVKKPATPAIVAPSNGSRVSIVVGYALAQVGKPYVWGAAGPGSYDCSGLVMASFARVGIRLPHQSGGQASAGRAVTRAQLQRGDIILYSGHVAIALGGGKMVHAANPRTGIVVAAIYGSPIGYRRLL